MLQSDFRWTGRVSKSWEDALDQQKCPMIRVKIPMRDGRVRPLKIDCAKASRKIMMGQHRERHQALLPRGP